jgi:hypothetical protein
MAFQTLFVPGIGITNTTPLRPNSGSFFAFWNLFQKIDGAGFSTTSGLIVLQESVSKSVVHGIFLKSKPEATVDLLGPYIASPYPIHCSFSGVLRESKESTFEGKKFQGFVRVCKDFGLHVSLGNM